MVFPQHRNFPTAIKYFTKIAANLTATAVLVTALFPTACNTIQPPARFSSSGILDQVLQNNSINVSLAGLMTFNDHGQNVTSFKEFGVQNVPLTWSDTTFKGNTTSYPAPRMQVIDHVHGVVTEDGRFLEHVSFWREIKEEGRPDIIFDITVYAIPMDGSGCGNCTPARIFERTGDAKKYVLDMTFIQEGVEYVCTDWGNKDKPPVLKIQFGF